MKGPQTEDPATPRQHALGKPVRIEQRKAQEQRVPVARLRPLPLLVVQILEQPIDVALALDIDQRRIEHLAQKLHHLILRWRVVLEHIQRRLPYVFDGLLTIELRKDMKCRGVDAQVRLTGLRRDDVPDRAAIIVTMSHDVRPDSRTEIGHAVPLAAKQTFVHDLEPVSPKLEPEPVDKGARPDPSNGLGLDVDQSKAVGSEVLGFIKEKAPAEVVTAIEQNIPELNK